MTVQNKKKFILFVLFILTTIIFCGCGNKILQTSELKVQKDAAIIVPLQMKVLLPTDWQWMSDKMAENMTGTATMANQSRAIAYNEKGESFTIEVFRGVANITVEDYCQESLFPLMEKKGYAQYSELQKADYGSNLFTYFTAQVEYDGKLVYETYAMTILGQYFVQMVSASTENENLLDAILRNAQKVVP